MENNNSEYEYRGAIWSGFAMLFVVAILLPAILVWMGILAFDGVLGEGTFAWLCVALIGAICILSMGFFIQQPNKARAMLFFGKYQGTFRRTGFYWMNPLMRRIAVSLRLQNMDIAPIKVNDKVGNPVMIGMVLVWRIRDTYRAIFDVDTQLSAGAGTTVGQVSMDRFVAIQSDAALREVASIYAYDTSENGHHDEVTLRSGGKEISDILEERLNERLSMAGIEIVEARLNYLAYAPEIAAVMLRRQQASAIIAAREKIVEGAVSMVKLALDQLETEKVVTLSADQRSALVSNLLVVLCADEPAQPVLNAGH